MCGVLQLKNAAMVQREHTDIARLKVRFQMNLLVKQPEEAEAAVNKLRYKKTVLLQDSFFMLMVQLQSAVAMFKLFTASAGARVIASNLTPSGRIVRVKLHITILKRFWFIAYRRTRVIATY